MALNEAKLKKRCERASKDKALKESEKRIRDNNLIDRRRDLEEKLDLEKLEGGL
jgi:hypothetical protein